MVLHTGGEIAAKYLVREGVPYLAGIGGHGIMPFLDAFIDQKDRIEIIQVRHEQAATHLADGYYRASGKPLAVFTSLGPALCNATIGIATAFVDSSAMVVFSGEAHTYMFGVGTLQEIERTQSADAFSITRPITKRVWRVTRVEELPRVINAAFRVATTGRPGPVHVILPMDVQADAADIEIPDPVKHKPFGRIRGDPDQVKKAAELLVTAERPVILAGGGVILSGAHAEVIRLAEYLGAAVVTTMMGKGAIPEDHPLCAFYTGAKATTCGNKLTRDADVILAVGCRFADETTSSYKPGVSFNVPPTKLIHVDIDPNEIGKNYPVEVGIVGDANITLRDIINTLKTMMEKKKYQELPYFKRILRVKREWEAKLAPLQKSNKIPMTLSRVLLEIRKALERNAIVVGAAGHAQAQLFQEFPIYEPRTHLSSGGFSTMGWCIPATQGAKLAKPDRQVLGLCGDGDFLMTCQELATAVQYNIPVVYCVTNNYGWLSIRDLQIDVYGKDRAFASEFRMQKNGELYNPDFVKLAESFKCYSERIETPEEVAPGLERAFKSGKPAVLEIPVQHKYPFSEGVFAGWWDVPVPAYLRK